MVPARAKRDIIDQNRGASRTRMIQGEKQGVGLPGHIANENRIDRMEIDIGGIQGLVIDDLVARLTVRKSPALGVRTIRS